MLNKILEFLPIVPCQVATRLMSESMERRLSIKERLDLWLHMKVCDLCVRFLKQIKGLRQMIRTYAYQGEEQLPQEIKNQIKKNLLI